MKILILGHLPRKAGYDYTPMERKLKPYVAAGTTLHFDSPDDFDGSRAQKVLGKQQLLNGLDHAMATASLVRKVVWAAENGFDAVVQSNNFDPGVEAARLSVSIPVIGIFRTALHVAANLADRIGIMVPLESHIPYTWRLLRTYGMADAVVDIRSLGIYGDDLKDRLPEITDKSVSLIRGLTKESGAQFIVPLGGALIPAVVDPARLQELTGVPVINTTLAAVRFAETCVATGLSQSPLCYPCGDLTYADVSLRA